METYAAKIKEQSQLPISDEEERKKQELIKRGMAAISLSGPGGGGGTS
jgi:hypothetical protein